MKDCQCSQCGVSATAPVWGFALLTQGGWSIASTTNPPGAAERGWLCTDCGGRAQGHARGLGRVSAPKVQRERTHTAETRPTEPLKILVVDDHELVLRSMVRLLAGCETVVANSPREALSLLQGDHQFDVILSDVMMPEMTGPELYERCYARSPELARRFLFASGAPVLAARLIDQVVARVSAEHAPPLLSKPTSRSTLMAAVAAVAANAPSRSGTYELRLPADARAEQEDTSFALADTLPDTSIDWKRSSRY
ncbi:MAG TPA: response regulator [Polyangiaceae bacterium]